MTMHALSPVLALLLTIAALPVAAANPFTSEASYSADYVMETADGAMQGKINVAPGKERREDHTPTGESMISIRRDDLGKMWMLMPSERMYMEIDFQNPASSIAPRTPSPEEYETEMTEEGREEVNGLMTTKSKVIMTDPDGARMGGFWWMADAGILVKMDVIAVDDGEKMRMKRELTNIVIEPQDEALFEIPAGYSSMMMGMGAGMLGIPGLPGIPGMGGEPDEPDASDSSGEGTTEEPPKKKGFGFGTLKGVLEAVQ